MSACRASAAALAFALAAAPALAQVGPPVRLTPPAAPIPPPAQPPRPAAPASPSREADAQLEATPVDPQDSSRLLLRRRDPNAIEVAEPEKLSPEGVGALDPAQAGLPSALWQRSERAEIERLVAELPIPSASPAARDLIRRLLASAAPPPRQAEASATPAGSALSPGFAALRADRLYALGAVEAAAELARLAPGRDQDASLSRLQVDAALAGGDLAQACTTVRTLIAQATGTYLQRALIFCQAAANDAPRAQLGLRMLRELQPEDDAVFDRLIALVLGEARGAVGSLRQAAPLHVAMVKALSQPIPGDALQAGDPTVLAMIALSANVTADTRLAAAERAEALGSLSAEALAQVYAAQPARPDDLARVASGAPVSAGSRGRILLYRMAQAQPAGPGRAEALQRGWQLARERDGYAAAVRVSLPLLLELPPVPDLAWFAGDAARALIAAGRVEEARRWLDMMAAPITAEPLRARLDALAWPVARLRGGLVDRDPPRSHLAAWSQAQDRDDARARPVRAALLARLFSALGDSAAAQELGVAAPADAPVAAVAAQLDQLAAAAADSRTGETALRALAMLGPNGGAGAPPVVIARAVEALKRVGLEADARALAVEAAIAAGL